MARNLDVLIQPLAVVAEPGLDALDPRFSAITTLASHGQYGPAADQIEALLVEGIYDVRFISIYLFQAFREAGINGLGDVLAVVDALLGDSFEAVGPVKKREETFDRRVGWLFGEITDTIEYHSTKQTPEWEALCAGVTEETLDAITASMAAVAEKITARGFRHAARSVARLEGSLAKQAGAIVGPAAPAPGAAPAGAPGGASAPSRASDAPLPGAASASGGAAGEQGDGSRRQAALVVSHRFLELTRKLHAFEVLIQKRQFRKAALVADDLQQLIEHFDPRTYFPEVFTGFAVLFSENIDMLSEQWGERETIAWSALGQLYQTDLDRFVKG